MLRAAIWLVPIALLMIALLDMPYGYYQLLRVYVFCTSAYLAVQQNKSKSDIWFWGLVACALTYNPIIKLSLGREIWPIVNVATVIFYIWHFCICNKYKTVFRGE
jgi:Family of unknown function (DUF6804)